MTTFSPSLIHISKFYSIIFYLFLLIIAAESILAEILELYFDLPLSNTDTTSIQITRLSLPLSLLYRRSENLSESHCHDKELLFGMRKSKEPIFRFALAITYNLSTMTGETRLSS
jgi:hypothetical protein